MAGMLVGARMEQEARQPQRTRPLSYGSLYATRIAPAMRFRSYFPPSSSCTSLTVSSRLFPSFLCATVRSRTADQIGAVVRDERDVTHGAVAGDDALRLQLLESVHAGEPRRDPRLRADRRQARSSPRRPRRESPSGSTKNAVSPGVWLKPMAIMRTRTPPRSITCSLSNTMSALRKSAPCSSSADRGRETGESLGGLQTIGGNLFDLIVRAHHLRVGGKRVCAEVVLGVDVGRRQVQLTVLD